MTDHLPPPAGEPVAAPGPVERQRVGFGSELHRLPVWGWLVLAAVLAGVAGFVAGRGKADDSTTANGTAPTVASTAVDDSYDGSLPDPVAAETTTAVPGSTGDVLPLQAGGLFTGTATPNLPAGEPGKVTVVGVGAVDFSSSFGTTVPVVVRNRTGETLTSLEVTGSARASGSLVGSGSSQVLHPAVLAPGGVALGYVYFDSQLPPDSEFQFSVSGEPEGESFLGSIDLTVSEVNVVAGRYGQTAIGAVTNPGDAPVSQPIRAAMFCFDGDTFLSVEHGYTDGSDDLAPGATATFSIDLSDRPCPQYAVASSGHSW